MTQKQKTYKPEKTNNFNMIPSDPKGSLDESFFNKSNGTLVLIDAGFLSKLSKHFGNGVYLKYDLIKFSKNLAFKENKTCKGIFYYTAPPFQSPIPSEEEKRRKDRYDKFVNKLKEKGVVVREGRCQRLKLDGKFIYKQKGVDTLMTIDLMSIPIKHPYIKEIILIASDSDFVPVINTLNSINIKLVLYTYYEKGRDAEFSTSNELIKSVYKYVLLKKEDFDTAPLNKNGTNNK
ncbi:MAG: NYN domain-containing protein [Candidatus Pacearchaeota archaeon]